MHEEFENQQGQGLAPTTDGAIENALGQIGILLNPLDAAAIAVKAQLLWPVLDSPLVRTAVGPTASVQQRAVATVSLIPQAISNIENDRDRHVAEMWFAVDPAYDGLRLTKRLPILLEKRKIPVGTAPSRRNTILGLMAFQFLQDSIDEPNAVAVHFGIAQSNFRALGISVKGLCAAAITCLYLSDLHRMNLAGGASNDAHLIEFGEVSSSLGDHYLRTIALADWCIGIDPWGLSMGPLTQVAAWEEVMTVRRARDRLVFAVHWTILSNRYAIREHYFPKDRPNVLQNSALPAELRELWTSWVGSPDLGDRFERITYHIAARGLGLFKGIAGLGDEPMMYSDGAIRAITPRDIALELLSGSSARAEGRATRVSEGQHAFERGDAERRLAYFEEKITSLLDAPLD